MKFAGEHIQRYVRMMTNNQRNLWARAGYPVDKDSLEKYSGEAVRKWGERRAQLIERRFLRVLSGGVL